MICAESVSQSRKSQLTIACSATESAASAMRAHQLVTRSVAQGRKKLTLKPHLTRSVRQSS